MRLGKRERLALRAKRWREQQAAKRAAAETENVPFYRPKWAIYGTPPVGKPSLAWHYDGRHNVPRITAAMGHLRKVK